MNITKSKVLHGSASILLALACAQAQAAPGYCSDNAADAPLAVSDLTFNGFDADDCYGYVGNIANDADIAAGANGLAKWGGGWTFIVKDDVNGSASGSFGGYNWTLSAQNDLTEGTWDLTLSPATGLPKLVDFVAYIKGGTGGAYFLFNDELVAEDNAGTFKMTFVQGAGANAGAAALSGFSLLGRNLRDCPATDPRCDDGTGPGGDPLPEPGTLALVALAMLGVGAARRRKRA